MAPHKCADGQRAAALALPQREKLGVDDVVGKGTLEPSPTARHTHAAASDEASVNNEAATTNQARVRPIRFSPEALGLPGVPGARLPVGFIWRIEGGSPVDGQSRTA
jgi:hypothetical protein